MKKDNRNVYGNYELLDTILNKAVGKTLRRLRVERNLTQVELRDLTYLQIICCKVL